uniref:Uncharacterized protein n=1 Tax=Octopus bimaculoides TaxID=37653 RepID=A0A0L8HLC3_OCTBM
MRACYKFLQSSLFIFTSFNHWVTAVLRYIFNDFSQSYQLQCLFYWSVILLIFAFNCIL